MVNLGGDADSAGAILGALAGAWHGVDAIPARWLDGLQNREGVDARAQALARRSTAGIEIPDLVTTEQVLSAREADCRNHLIAAASSHTGGGDFGANQRV